MCKHYSTEECCLNMRGRGVMCVGGRGRGWGRGPSRGDRKTRVEGRDLETGVRGFWTIGQLLIN